MPAPRQTAPLAELLFERRPAIPSSRSSSWRPGRRVAADLRTRHGGLELGPAADPRQGLHRQRGGSHGGEAEPPAACDSAKPGPARLPGKSRGDGDADAGPWRERGGDSRAPCGKPPVPGSCAAPTPPTPSFTTASRRRPTRSSLKGSASRHICGSAGCSRRERTAEELEEKIFDIVNQFDRGAALITEPAEREQVAAAQPDGGHARQGGNRLCRGPAVFHRRPPPAGGERMGGLLPARLRSRAQPRRM